MPVKSRSTSTMPLFRLKFAGVIAFAVIAPAAALAQEGGNGSPTLPDSTPDRAPASSWLPLPPVYGAWVAGAHASPFRTRTGVPGRRDFYLGAIRMGWPIGGDHRARVANVQYFVDILPFAVTTGMPDYTWDRRCRPGFMCPGATPTRHTVYAFGVTPIGWSLSLGGPRARLTLEASGGGLWFARPIPDPEATRFNFTASVGPTLDLAVGPTSTLRLGYLWHHTSNAGTGRINPGLDTGILSVGLLHRARRSDR